MKRPSSIFPLVVVCYLTMEAPLVASQVESSGDVDNYTWLTLRGSCTATCGPTGVVPFLLLCRDATSGETVDEVMCSPDTRPSDPTTEPCNRRPCHGQWKADAWTECSATCEGNQTQTFYCEQMQLDGSVERVGDNQCNKAKPKGTVRPCGNDTCIRYRWVIIAGSCTHTCGPMGVRPYLTQCQHEDTGSTVDQVYCEASEQPLPPLEECNRVACPAQWNIGAWSFCSATCNGMKTRSVSCVQLQGDLGTQTVSNSECPDEKPVEQISCSDACSDVIFRWALSTGAATGTGSVSGGGGGGGSSSSFSKWSQCSVTCGSGEQTRNVRCEAVAQDGSVTVVFDEMCERMSNESKPVLQRSCTVLPSDNIWTTSDWFGCSRPCGRGAQKRQVKCVRGCSLRPLGAGQCSRSARPIHHRYCNDFPCESEGCQDSSTCLCKVVQKFQLCSSAKYNKICCRSCRRQASRKKANIFFMF